MFATFHFSKLKKESMRKLFGKFVNILSKPIKTIFVLGLLIGMLTFPIWGVFLSDRFGFSPYITFTALTILLFSLGIFCLVAPQIIIKNKFSNLLNSALFSLKDYRNQFINWGANKTSKTNAFIPLADKPKRAVKIIIIQDLSIERAEEVSIQLKRSKKYAQNIHEVSR